MSLDVRKTYKLFIGGKFPRSESGRAYQPAGCPQVNVARASRKDLRDAVGAARAAAAGWSGMTAYNRGQIVYRLAEVLQTRSASLADEIAACTSDGVDVARAEVAACIDLVTWYAGLPDKLQSLLGSQNAVSGPFFNFSAVEPTGTIGLAAPTSPPLLGLLALLLPVLSGANTAVVVVSEPAPLAGLALGELLAVSDVPSGVVNLLAGSHEELLPQMASHRDVDGLLLAGAPDRALGEAAADSTKRVRFADLPAAQWREPRALCQLSWVEPFVEVKTFWHPVAE
ncbi:MAG: aldehyde dehydrogenase family protein [Planctomycetota bacterium]